MNIEIYQLGTEVEFNVSGIPGVITAVTIRGSYIQYEIGYWGDREYKIGWFIEEEFRIVTDWPKNNLGFKP